jgi:uncharacterized membrane protein
MGAVLMIDMKILGRSLIVAVVIGTISAAVADFFFRGWAEENSMTMAIVLGGICGLIYPILARIKRT